MPDVIVPRGNLAVQELWIHVGERAELQIPLVGVVDVEGELGILLPRFHHRRVLEAVGEAECAVVMEVVPQPHVGRRGLRRRGFERRVRIGERHRRRPAVVGHAEHPGAAVVRGHVLHEPIDRVVGVGRFIDCLGVVPMRRVAHGALHHELAFRLVAATDVLKREDVAVVIPTRRDARPRIGDPVGRAAEENRSRRRGGFRYVDLGIEAHAVAHRHHRGDVRELRAVVGLRARDQRRGNAAEGQEQRDEWLAHRSSGGSPKFWDDQLRG